MTAITSSNLGKTLNDVTIPTSQRTSGPNMTQQDFLKIMIEQMKGANPLDAESGDNTQFFAQLVQFQTLDAMTAMQKAIDHLSQVSGLANAASLIGKTITATIAQPNDPKTGLPQPDQPVTGKVLSVTFGDAGAVLRLDGNLSVPATKVTAVR